MDSFLILMGAAVLLAPPTADRVSSPPALHGASAAEKRVCRTMTNLGSILPRHVCATRGEWDEVVRANEADADILRFSQHPNAPTQSQQLGRGPTGSTP